MCEVPSRQALDRRSYRHLRCLRRRMVEFMGHSGFDTAISALSRLDLARS